MAHFSFRKVQVSDCQFLYEIRTDPDTVASSIKQSPPTPRTHNEWMREALEPGPNTVYIVLEHSAAGMTAVGTITEQRLPENRRGLAWTVHPDHRRRGVGSAMIKEDTKKLDASLCIEAHIRPENIASIKVAERAGFRWDARVDEWGLAVYTLNEIADEDPLDSAAS